MHLKQTTMTYVIIRLTSVCQYNAQPFECPVTFMGSKSEKYARKVQNRLFFLPSRFENPDLCEKYLF